MYVYIYIYIYVHVYIPFSNVYYFDKLRIGVPYVIFVNA